MTQIILDPEILKDRSLNFVDMHHHSNVSDGDSSPEFLVKVFRKKGLGLCIADHNQIKGSVYLCKQKDMFAIPSVEITSRQSKDVLAYFYHVNDMVSFWEREIKKNIRNNSLFNLNRTTIDVFSLVDKIKAYNGIPVLAHPFSPKPKESYKLLEDKDFQKGIMAIESHNFVTGKYEKTYNFLKKFNKPLIGGSDSHRTSVFNTLTATSCFDVESFLGAVLKNKNMVYYVDDNFYERIANTVIILKNNICLIPKKNG